MSPYSASPYVGRLRGAVVKALWQFGPTMPETRSEPLSRVWQRLLPVVDIVRYDTISIESGMDDRSPHFGRQSRGELGAFPCLLSGADKFE